MYFQKFSYIFRPVGSNFKRVLPKEHSPQNQVLPDAFFIYFPKKFKYCPGSTGFPLTTGLYKYIFFVICIKLHINGRRN